MDASARTLFRSAHAEKAGDETVASVLDEYLVTGIQHTKRVRKTHVFHPSSLGTPCDRALQLEYMGAGVVKDGVSAKLQTTFQFGSEIHKLLQEWLGRSGRLYGNWRCKDCRETREMCPIPAREGCARGEDDLGLHRWKFMEVPAVDGESHIMGTSDGLLLLHKKGKPKLFVLEAKSSNQKGFDARRKNGPDASHVLQCLAYMYCLGIDDGIVLYQCKNDSERIEYYVTWSDKFPEDDDGRTNREVWDAQLERLREIREAIEEKRLLSRYEDNRYYGACANCSLATVCWGTNRFAAIEQTAATGRIHR